MFGLPKFGQGISLSRILRFMDEQRIDLDRLSRNSIVITGSNGKGSTARCLAAALGATGRTVGLFTSPHLFDVRERFQLGDQTIDHATFDRYAALCLSFNASRPDGDKMGAFELLFLIAASWFNEQKPEAIVWEAGIGGRYDPVRTLQAKLSVLTGLELEHTEILGASEELIAYDKIDALAPGGRLIVSAGVAYRHREKITNFCRLTQRRPRFAADCVAISAVQHSAVGTRFTLGFLNDPDRARTLELSLIGRHQVDNALTAYLTACTFLDRPASIDDPLLDAVAAARWPGRLERVARAPDLWIDVGHTPNAVRLVCEAFQTLVPKEKTLVVFGASAAKDVAAMAQTVASAYGAFILTKAFKGGAEIESFASLFAGRDVLFAPTTTAAAAIAKERASREGLSVLALGGLFVAVEVQCAWQGGDPEALAFF